MKPLLQLINLSDKSAIVTGGAKGIGYGISYRLAEAGAKVLVVDIDEAGAIQTAKELTGLGWIAEASTVDVSDEDDIKRMIAVCREKFGSVDILVNNAGIYPPITYRTYAINRFRQSGTH